MPSFFGALQVFQLSWAVLTDGYPLRLKEQLNILRVARGRKRGEEAVIMEWRAEKGGVLVKRPC